MDKYRKIFSQIFNVEESELNETFTFADKAVWDSISHLNLITALEDEFDVMFSTEEILHYGSFLNGIEILKRYGVEF